MLKNGITPFRLGLTIFGVDLFPSYDVIDTSTPTAQKLAQHIEVVKQTETGWDRLKAIFQRDDFGNLSPEMDGALSAGTAGLIIGFFLGGLPASKKGYEEFITRNKATSFETHFQAKEKLQFNVTKSMASGGWRVGWRLGLFAGTYTFFTAAVATYRNQTTVFEYTAGGLLAGAIYKFPMGPKAMVAGGLGGAALGTVAGAISVGVMKLTGTTGEELRYLRHGWKEAKQRELIIESPRRAQAMGNLGLAHDHSLVAHIKPSDNEATQTKLVEKSTDEDEVNNSDKKS